MIAQVAGEQNLHKKILIFFKKSLSKIQEYQQERMVRTLAGVHLPESLYIPELKWHPYKMHVRKERKNHKWSWLTGRKLGFT